MANLPGVSDIMLHEIEPRHWVACWRTAYVARMQETFPDPLGEARGS
jgi:hypothetical protein